MRHGLLVCGVVLVAIAAHAQSTGTATAPTARTPWGDPDLQGVWNVASGTPLPAILLRHILPNTLAPLLVQGTFVCASAMITEAILSFIGAGTPPYIPSWGNIMAEARSLFQIAFYLILFPGICLSLTVLAVNLLGDGLRDALDPRLARRM